MYLSYGLISLAPGVSQVQIRAACKAAKQYMKEQKTPLFVSAYKSAWGIWTLETSVRTMSKKANRQDLIAFLRSWFKANKLSRFLRHSSYHKPNTRHI